MNVDRPSNAKLMAVELAKNIKGKIFKINKSNQYLKGKYNNMKWQNMINLICFSLLRSLAASHICKRDYFIDWQCK